MRKFFVIFIVFIMLIFILFPIFINYIMDFSFKVAGGESEWIPFFASFYGALLGGIISGALTLGGVYITIRHDRENRIVDSYPVKRKYAGEVLDHIDQFKIALMDSNLENEDNLELTDNVNQEIEKLIKNTNEILNSASMVNGKVFYLTRKIIAHSKALINVSSEAPIHPYHALDLMETEVAYARIILDSIEKIESETKQIDLLLDKLQ